MNKLDRQDLAWAVRRLPKNLKDLMLKPEWRKKIYVGGGYLRALVSGEEVNDVDVFVQTKADAEKLQQRLTSTSNGDYYMVETDNAFTVVNKHDRGIPIQVIFRWVFEKPEDVANSFDFTICCAVIYFDDVWDSYTDERFYVDLASKRLIYREPVRNEDAGGSMLRVLKYYHKGYRIPLDSLGKVIARLNQGIDREKLKHDNDLTEADIITGLLREVDPVIDPLHLSHLPSGKEIQI